MSAGARQYQFDDVTVQPDAFRVEKFGRPVSLEPKSIRLLVYLIEHRSRAVGKEELLREVWPDAAVTDNALTRVVAQLRKALGDHAKVARYIETIPTLGYRFIPEVAELEGDPAPDARRAAAESSIPTWNWRPRIKGAGVFAFAAMIGGVVWLGWRSPVPTKIARVSH